MRFTLKLTDDATDTLAIIWMGAPDRRAVNAADSQIAIMLTTDPANVGAPVAEGLRKLHVSPLTVYYSVDEDEMLVEISAVVRDS